MSTESSNNTAQQGVPSVDYTLSPYDLTSRFFSYYRYHNDASSMAFDEMSWVKNPANGVMEPMVLQKTLSRFSVMRRIKACLLSSRPFMGNQEIAPQKPNTNLGYLKLLKKYVDLPYKSVTSEFDLIKIRFNRKLKESIEFSKYQKTQRQLETNNNPNIYSNAAISDDTSDAFNYLLSQSRCMQDTARRMASDVTENAFAAVLHLDPGWETEVIEGLDLVFEPQAYWDTGTWNNFFIVRKLPAQEAITIIREDRPFWNIPQLRWALENAQQGRSVFNTNYGQAGASTLGTDSTPLCGENYMVKSFYADKAHRTMNLQGYYGNLLIVEAYYMNQSGSVQKTIFFPSGDLYNVDHKDQLTDFTTEEAKKRNLHNAGVLFDRKLSSKKSIRDVVTIVPYDRAEPTLERQRGPMHELYNPIEMVMRTDTAILNVVSMMSVLYYRNRNEGASSQTLQDLEIKMTGEMQDIGDRDFVDQPLQHDLNAMITVRSMLLQHAMAKAFLSGLDNLESVGEGRGADIAKYRLVRDGRVLKHDIDDFGVGQTEVYTKVLRNVLDEMLSSTETQDRAVKYLFTLFLTDEMGYKKELFEFKEKEILEDTLLPYWMNLVALRNGASHMGPAEMVLYSEIKQVYGDTLDITQLKKLAWMGIKSSLNSQDAMDILGNPREQVVTDSDQVHEAQVETAAILGSVSSSALNFSPIGIKESKDDPITHLREVHNPKCMEIIETLQSAEVTPSELEGQTEEQLDTRVNLILRLAAITNHTSLHLQQLEFFGDARPDVNQLKEETNTIIQSSEGLLNNLQLSLRALQAKRQDKELRLQNISPENEAEKMKQEGERMKLQAEMQRDQGKLTLANKIADQGQKQHLDKQLSKARDRAQKSEQAKLNAQGRIQEAETNVALKVRESDLNTSLKVRDFQTNAATKTRDADISRGLKVSDAATSIGLKAREAKVKTDIMQKQAEAKINVMKKQSDAKSTSN